MGFEVEDRPCKILTVLHQEHSSAGRVGMALNGLGYDLDIRRPALGDKLPQTLKDHAGSIIFGGPMSANDNDEFIKREIDWIDVPLKENKPFWGICLGAQMLSKNLGGSVQANEKEFAEIGYYPIEGTSKGNQLMDWPSMVYQWHREGFSLPSGAELLATSNEYPNQAMRVDDNAYGVQFHCELTFQMLYRWTVKAEHRFELNGAQNRKQHIEGRLMYDKAVRSWLDNFLDIWIGPANSGA